MKRLFVLLFLIPLFFGCSKDDKETVYVDTNRTVTEYRIDKIKFSNLGEYWIRKYVNLTIYNEQNIVIYAANYPQISGDTEEDVFPISSASKLRIKLSTSGGNGIEFLTEAKPWENFVAPTIFRIVVDRNESFSDRIQLELWGTVIAVSK